MFAIFRRGLGQSEVELLADPNRSMLKLRACKKWGVEKDWDNGDAWSALLDEGLTIIYDDDNEIALFSAWDQGNGEEVTLFDGDFKDIKLDSNEWTAFGGSDDNPLPF